MKTNVGRVLGVGWLGVACLGLLPLSPLSAQEAKLRDTLKGHKAGVFSVAFSPDGKTPATGDSHETIKLRDVATGKEQATLNGHAEAVWSLAYSPDGKTLAAGNLDRTVKLWDVATGKEQFTLKGHKHDVM